VPETAGVSRRGQPLKKLINDPRHVVREMLEGLADITPGVALLDDADVIIRADLPEPVRRGVAWR
jgi:dihydroxyacetone kinase